MSDPYTSHTCAACGYEGFPKRRGKGNVGVELLLWIVWTLPLFLIDGVSPIVLGAMSGLLILSALAYSIWRARSFQMVCPKCNSSTLTVCERPPALHPVAPFDPSASAQQITGPGDSGPPQSLRTEWTPSLILRLTLYGAWLVAGVLSMWLQVGPYAYIADLLAGSSGSYSSTFANLGTIMVFILPTGSILRMHPAWMNPKWQVMAKRRALAALAACVLVIGFVSWFQVKHVQSPRKVSGIREAASSATFFPTDVVTGAKLNPSDYGEAYSIAETEGARVRSKDFYVPLAPSMWPSPELPVILQMDEWTYEKGPKPTYSGELSLIKKPVPHLLRKSDHIPKSASFAIFVHPRKSEHSFWVGGIITSLLGAVFVLIYWLRKRKAWNAVLGAN